MYSRIVTYSLLRHKEQGATKVILGDGREVLTTRMYPIDMNNWRDRTGWGDEQEIYRGPIKKIIPNKIPYPP